MSNSRLANKLVIGGILAMQIFVSNLEADVINWVGDESDDWHTGTNWTASCPGGGPFCGFFVPGVGDDAVLTNASFGTNVQLSSNAHIRGLTIGSGIDLNTNGFRLIAGGSTTFPTVISGSGTNLLVPHAPNAPDGFATHQFQLSSGGGIVLGGLGQTGAQLQIGEPGSSIGAGSTLS